MRARGNGETGLAAGCCHMSSNAVKMSQHNNVTNVIWAQSNYDLIQNNVIIKQHLQGNALLEE